MVSEPRQKAERKDKLNEAKLNRDIKVLEHEATSQSLDQRAQNRLDVMAQKEAAASYWDEFLVLSFLAPFFYTVAYPFLSGTLVHPDEVWKSIESTADWYRYGLLLIGVRYLGFRRLFNKFLDKKLSFGKKVV